MNPISLLLKLPAEATVGDARKLVAEQVMTSTSCHPGREALLSALECGPYDRKFGKRRGKSLTLLNEQLPLGEHHGMILQEAHRELCNSLHELVQDELEARPLYRLDGEIPVIVNFDTPDALPPEWRPDVVQFFRTSETTLKKHARELIQGRNFLTHEQLSPTQLSSLASVLLEPPEEDSDQEEDEDDKD